MAPNEYVCPICDAKVGLPDGFVREPFLNILSAVHMREHYTEALSETLGALETIAQLGERNTRDPERTLQHVKDIAQGALSRNSRWTDE